jgi:asparagine synthase (glutamine-hydrolysing)
LNTLNVGDFSSKPFDNEWITVLLDGEIFNRAEVMNKLNTLQFSESFKLSESYTPSDSELIAQAYLHWQLDFLEHLDGKWAIVIYDKKQEKIIAIRDRFAFKPLYFSTINNQFCIASEIKQFTILRGWQARLNHARARDFLAFGRQDHTDETLFEGVNQVMMGEYTVFDLKTHELTTAKYYDLKKYPPPEKIGMFHKYKPFEKAKTDLQNIVFEGINRHLTSGGTFGTMLSGGLDSTIVTLALKQLLEKQGGKSSFETFSLTLAEPHPLDESKFIDIVTDFGAFSTHKTQPDFSVFQQKLDDFLYTQDEPVYTDSAFAQYMVFQKAGEMGVRRVFGGTGADAALAGYTKYILLYVKKLRSSSPLLMVKEFLGFMRYGGWRHIPYLLKKRRFSNSHFSNWLNPDFASATLQSPLPEVETMEDYTMEHFLTDATVALHFDDRNASAASVESYFPMYDRRFVESSIAMPDHYKIKNGKQKYILREAFKDLLPPQIYNRHDKKGFYNPGEDWMQQNPDWWMKEMQTIVADNPTIFEPKFLTIFEDFVRKNRLSVPEGVFWRVFFFGKWMRRFDVM